jgi:hypothetical protein
MPNPRSGDSLVKDRQLAVAYAAPSNLITLLDADSIKTFHPKT